MVSNSEKAKGRNIQANAERSLVRNYFERVETRRHPPKFRNEYGEGIVQGVRKLTQTGILWSQVQVLVGPPEKQTLISNDGGFVF
ncbi:hypothetical protein A8O14_09455 [Polynucleobacter wuianus]|uniref:Uncharacterized protein n=1 Tax=Polynucleobacter wuianus TaxID=1743168 RepID=A0A191UGZ2_9BURK|nr:hypothetical protein A8O14_09455 [Polynucleobacter wuianus]